MKRNHIAKIAALRANLNRYAYRPAAMIEHIKDYLGDDLGFEFSTTINHRSHESYAILIFDKQGDTREIITELCANVDEFTFSKIGVGETVYASSSQLAMGINNINRMASKQAWIVPLLDDKGGSWKVLVSYKTIIAAWKTRSNLIYLQRNARNYSNTTRRHLFNFERYVNDSIKALGETAVLKWANWE